jgi:hypothetical protein
MLSSLGGAKETVTQLFPGIEVTLYPEIRTIATKKAPKSNADNLDFC